MSKVDQPTRGPKCSAKGCNCPASDYHTLCIAHLSEYQDSAIVRNTTYPKPDDASKTGS